MQFRPLLATLAVTALTAVGGAAYATVNPADEASPVIDVTRTDKSGDVHVEKTARDLPRRITHSVDLPAVDLHIDRTAETLTVTYPLKRVLTGDRFRQVVGTSITADKGDNQSPYVGLISTTVKKTVRVYTYDADGSWKNGVCKAGSSVTDPKADTVEQTVPFSCLRGVLDHGSFRFFGLVEKRSTGADVSFDLTGYTRDLPLSAYVDPGTPQG